MSRKDLDRLEVLKKVQNKELKQIEAARLLKFSDRHVRTLLTRLEQEGPEGITSRLLGKNGNHSKPSSLKKRVLSLLSEKYEGFSNPCSRETR